MAHQMRSIVQTFSPEAIHVGLEGGVVTREARDKLDILLGRLSLICFLCGQIERPWKNPCLFEWLIARIKAELAFD